MKAKHSTSGGLNRIAILNKDGDSIGTLIFDPSISDLYKRCQMVKGRADKILAPLIRIDIAPDGTARGKNAFILHKTEKKYCCLLDYILGVKGASKFMFERVRPFASVGGRFFCQSVLEMTSKYISKPETDNQFSEGEKKNG